MRTIKLLFFCHLAALLFGLTGLIVFLPHPTLWENNPWMVQGLQWSLQYAGSLHILFGAATMLLFGLLFVGRKKTLIFFIASAGISLSMELLGTSTGLPFGPYSYTDFLGFKIAGLVPYSIPLSWFYMGFTSYILASLLVKRLHLQHITLWSLVLGAYFLAVWDLALDPAMASTNLPLHFWIWHEQGGYFGMPVYNLAGWMVNGLIFMSVSRLLWRENLAGRRVVAWLPFGVYLANIAFGVALNLGVGLWLPPILALVLGVLPAALTLRSQVAGTWHNSLLSAFACRVIRVSCWLLSVRHVTFSVEGRENVPASGPVLIAARHVHNLYDGCILLRTLPPRTHILVALDWITHRPLRVLMEWACNLAGWPVVLRAERLANLQSAGSVYTAEETLPYLRSALKDAASVLGAGEMLVLFPEGYPNIDPTYTPKTNAGDFLPFRPGLMRLLERAEQHGVDSVAVVPTGLTYQQRGSHWQAILRFGTPLYLRNSGTSEKLLTMLEQQVQALSS
jgi:putative membrane protein